MSSTTAITTSSGGGLPNRLDTPTLDRESPGSCSRFPSTADMLTLVGKKYIRLYSASLSEELYPYAETMLSNSSQVDLDDIDERKFPEVQELEFVDCILEEGEMLYIPPKWWHYVRSLTTSFSVSFWWSKGEESSSAS
ncbi:hypothetical protein L6164_019270 [Bauhinia variegata]|uniref:Uncharacterized protein n=1 Tax=Bauhinia variegata TaxID=167791 RepID=A0ACB9NDN8_BAUVA|nr:hypothetical protein L6164_019270 [Bauhinia variegata]